MTFETAKHEGLYRTVARFSVTNQERWENYIAGIEKLEISKTVFEPGTFPGVSWIDYFRGSDSSIVHRYIMHDNPFIIDAKTGIQTNEYVLHSTILSIGKNVRESKRADIDVVRNAEGIVGSAAIELATSHIFTQAGAIASDPRLALPVHGRFEI